MASQSDILASLLAAMPDTYDLSVGSFAWDILAACSEQLASLDSSLATAQGDLSTANLTGSDLDTRINDRTGLTRIAATYAIGPVTLTGTGTANVGDIVQTSAGTQFQVTTQTTITNSGDVPVQAVVAGSAGNVAGGTVTMFPVTLSGFTAVTNANPMTGGADAESDAAYLTRYYAYIQSPPTSGNKSQYVDWAEGYSGVGGAQCIPLWNGNNTVKVPIVDSNIQPPAATLVSDVQTYMDPGVTGLGEGVAPIGAFVTVEGASGVSINVAATLVLAAGYTLATVTANIQAALVSFLKTQYKQPTISYAKIGDTIFNTAGVSDYSNLTVNSGTASISVTTEQVAILGTTNFTT